MIDEDLSTRLSHFQFEVRQQDTDAPYDADDDVFNMIDDDDIEDEDVPDWEMIEDAAHPESK